MSVQSGDGQNQPLPHQTEAARTLPGAPEGLSPINFASVMGPVGPENHWPNNLNAYGPSQAIMSQFPPSPFAESEDKVTTPGWLSNSIANYLDQNPILPATAQTVDLAGGPQNALYIKPLFPDIDSSGFVPNPPSGEQLELVGLVRGPGSPEGKTEAPRNASPPGDTKTPGRTVHSDDIDAGLLGESPTSTRDTNEKVKVKVDFTTELKEANLVFNADGTIKMRETQTPDGQPALSPFQKDPESVGGNLTCKIYLPPEVEAGAPEKAWNSFDSKIQQPLSEKAQFDISKEDFIARVNEKKIITREQPTEPASPSEQPKRGAPSGGSCDSGTCGGSPGGGPTGGPGGDTGGSSGGSPGGGPTGGPGSDTGGSPGGSPAGGDTGGSSNPTDNGGRPQDGASAPSDRQGRGIIGGGGDAQPRQGDGSKGLPLDVKETHLPYGIRNSAERAVLNGIHPRTYSNFASTFFPHASFAAVDKDGDGIISADEEAEARENGNWDKLEKEEAKLDKLVDKLSQEDPESKADLTQLANKFKDHTGQGDFHKNLNQLMAQQTSGPVNPETVDKVFGIDQVGNTVNRDPIANTTKTAIARHLVNSLASDDRPFAKAVKSLDSEPAKNSKEQEQYEQNRQKILDLVKEHFHSFVLH